MDKTILLAALAALTLPVLTACSGQDKGELAYAPPSLFDDPTDPSDSVMRGAIQKFLAERQGPPNSQYEYVRADLNNDGLRDAVVIFSLPHNYWCGWSGCTMAIFEAGDNRFHFVSETERIRGPIQIADSATNNWKDIGIRLTGTGDYDRNVLLQFDGSAYPENPAAGTLDAPYDLVALGGSKVLP